MAATTTTPKPRPSGGDRGSDRPRAGGEGRAAALPERSPEPRLAAATTPAQALRVHFHELAAAAFRGDERLAESERAFEERHGRVEEVYYGRNLPGLAAALTAAAGGTEHERWDAARETIHIECGPEVQLCPEAERLLFECCSLYRQADLTLTGRDRRLCMRMIFGVISSLFRSLDRAAAGHRQLKSVEIEYLERERRRAQGYFERSAQRSAQLWYLAGMCAGFAAILAAVAGVLLPTDLVAMDFDRPAGILVATVTGGAFGAMVSVMYGITSGSLRLRELVLSAESGRGPLLAAGVLRPILGAVFGALLYVLVQSGLLPLDVPDGASDATLFYVAVAFVAGFSERWTRGIIAGTEERIGAGSRGRRPPGSGRASPAIDPSPS